MGDDGIRLNKFLSGAGICSRREADRLIEEGKVTVDGRTAVPGQKIKNGETVVCNGRTIAAGTKGAEKKPDRVLLAVHKPCGIVCTTSDKDRAPNIVDMVDCPVRIYPVGRLDKDSEGLILMTNQGDLVNRMMRGSSGHEKEYLVWIDRPVKPEFIQKMKKGVFLPELDVTTKPCFAEMTGEKSFRIILTQGLNRQIRRMCEQLGCKVRKLKRVRIMNIELGDLKAGESRPVSKKEYAELMRRLENTSGLSLKDRTVNEKGRTKKEKSRNDNPEVRTDKRKKAPGKRK
ncbi:pseudouridine synthase [Hungatella sp.]|uniref:pseudouridine synthase n=1 Tax=Hungatella sp. TaxID=2613924 RepID=UPI003992418E